LVVLLLDAHQCHVQFFVLSPQVGHQLVQVLVGQVVGRVVLGALQHVQQLGIYCLNLIQLFNELVVLTGGGCRTAFSAERSVNRPNLSFSANLPRY
jgi:hypothetical protein